MNKRIKFRRIRHNTAIVDVVPSLFDGQPVVILASGFRLGHNDKLGPHAIQIFYLRADIHPDEAAKTGADYSVCRNCPLKFTNNKVCYVGIHVLGNMYKAYHRGSYPLLGEEHLQEIQRYGKVLRLGGYGEAVSVPISKVQPLIDCAHAVLGYTHQWNSPLALPYKNYLQASVETLNQAKKAWKKGWKTYRIIQQGDKPHKNEILCPWHLPYPQQKQCQSCRLCNGKKQNIASYPAGGKDSRVKDYFAKIK